MAAFFSEKLRDLYCFSPLSFSSRTRSWLSPFPAVFAKASELSTALGLSHAEQWQPRGREQALDVPFIDHSPRSLHPLSMNGRLCSSMGGCRQCLLRKEKAQYLGPSLEIYFIDFQPFSSLFLAAFLSSSSIIPSHRFHTASSACRFLSSLDLNS